MSEHNWPVRPYKFTLNWTVVYSPLVALCVVFQILVFFALDLKKKCRHCIIRSSSTMMQAASYGGRLWNSVCPLAFAMLHGTCDAGPQARTFADPSGSLTRGQLWGSTVALTMCFYHRCVHAVSQLIFATVQLNGWSVLCTFRGKRFCTSLWHDIYSMSLNPMRHLVPEFSVHQKTTWKLIQTHRNSFWGPWWCVAGSLGSMLAIHQFSFLPSVSGSPVFGDALGIFATSARLIRILYELSNGPHASL